MTSEPPKDRAGELDLDRLEKVWQMAKVGAVQWGQSPGLTTHDIDDVLDLIAKARVSNPQLDREGVARVIDPKAWKRFDQRGRTVYAAHVTLEQRREWDKSFVSDSLSKADQIIALGGGKEAP